MFDVIAQVTTEMLGPVVPWLVGLLLSIYIADRILNFWKSHMREDPRPAATYATKEELTKLEGDIRELFHGLQGRLDVEVRDQAGKRKKLYEAIEGVRGEVISLKTDNASQIRQLFSLETKIDRLIERSPRT